MRRLRNIGGRVVVHICTYCTHGKFDGVGARQSNEEAYRRQPQECYRVLFVLRRPSRESDRGDVSVDALFVTMTTLGWQHEHASYSYNSSQIIRHTRSHDK